MPLGSQPASSTPSPPPPPGGKDASLYQFFAPGGVLAHTHPAYEFRRGQLQMAQAVEQIQDLMRAKGAITGCISPISGYAPLQLCVEPKGSGSD